MMSSANAAAAGDTMQDAPSAADLRLMCGAVALILDRMALRAAAHSRAADPRAPTLRGRAVHLLAAIDRMLLTTPTATVADRYAAAVLDLSNSFLALHGRRPAPPAPIPAAAMDADVTPLRPGALEKTIAALSALIAKVGKPPGAPTAAQAAEPSEMTAFFMVPVPPRRDCAVRRPAGARGRRG